MRSPRSFDRMARSASALCRQRRRSRWWAASGQVGPCTQPFGILLDLVDLRRSSSPGFSYRFTHDPIFTAVLALRHAAPRLPCNPSVAFHRLQTTGASHAILPEPPVEPVSHQCLREVRQDSHARCYYGGASRWTPLEPADEHAGCWQWVVSCGSRQVPPGMPAKPSVVVSAASAQARKARAPVWAMSTGRSAPSSPGPALSDVPVAAILAQPARQRTHRSSSSARGDRRRAPAMIARGRWRARLCADHPCAPGRAHVAPALRPSRHSDPHVRGGDLAPRSRPRMRRCRPTSPAPSPSIEPLAAKGSTQAPRGSVASSFLVRTPSGEPCPLWPRLGHGTRTPPAS